MMLSAADYEKKTIDEEIFHELEEWALNEQEVREALIEWENLSINKENKVLYEARLKFLRDQLSNIMGERRLGREEGRQEGVQEVALEMLKDGMTVELVAKYVKLPIEEVEKIQKMN